MYVGSVSCCHSIMNVMNVSHACPPIVHEQIHFFVPLCWTNPDRYFFERLLPIGYESMIQTIQLSSFYIPVCCLLLNQDCGHNIFSNDPYWGSLVLRKALRPRGHTSHVVRKGIWSAELQVDFLSASITLPQVCPWFAPSNFGKWCSSAHIARKCTWSIPKGRVI